MKTIRLGDAEVCPDQNCLIIGGGSVHLEPKVMDVLVMLIEETGEVVTRQRFIERVWAGRVVDEGVLTRCICMLRSALGDTASTPHYIQTVPKRGYRLMMVPERPASSTPWRHAIELIFHQSKLTRRNIAPTRKDV